MGDADLPNSVSAISGRVRRLSRLTMTVSSWVSVWSAVVLFDNRGASPALAAAGLAVF
jgi:hypothetical protein